MSQKVLGSQYAYRGHVVTLRLDQVEIDDGRPIVVTREIIEHRGAVAIVALDERRRVLMVRQFRAGTQSETLEIPAGTLEAGEEPAQCAVRELKEETGYHAARWKYLGAFFPSPGYSTEKIHLYLAHNLTASQAAPEVDEAIVTEWVPLTRAVGKIKRGEIMDGKTIIALQRVPAQRKRRR